MELDPEVLGGEERAAANPDDGGQAFQAAFQRAAEAANRPGPLTIPGALKAAGRLVRPSVERLLHAMLRSQRDVNAAVNESLTALNDSLARLNAEDARHTRSLAELRAADADLARLAAESRAALEEAQREARAREDVLRERLSAAEAALAALRDETRVELEAERRARSVGLEPLQQRLQRLAWHLASIPSTQGAEPTPAIARTPAAASEDGLDRLFVAGFSERFRGSREEIKENVKWYVDLLASKGVGTAQRPIVDLGCGRGELLEVLRSSGLHAEGVELSAPMATQCRELGLKVHTADALGFLERAPEASLGAITALHVVEHLPFDALLAFLRLAHRALLPGGVLVLETPNPDNLRVAARNFYLDPTHVRPLASPLLQFIAEAHGFAEVAIHDLHPAGELFQASGEALPLAQQLNAVICGPQDYALIAVLPS